jgi:hypothetical protein
VEFEVRELATMVREEDDDLADELLAAAGLAPEPDPQASAPEAEAAPIPAGPVLAPTLAPIAAAPALTPAPAHVIDAIVCAAADAADMIPRAMRPALRAAFVRARELRVSVEAIVLGLGEADRHSERHE